MIGRKAALLVAATVVLGACALAFGSTGADGKPETPKRVLIVLFDQMRPEYADQFGMTNFQKLRGEGTNFDKAYLGYMALGDGDRPQRDRLGACSRSTWAGSTRPTATPTTCSARAPTRCTSRATSPRRLRDARQQNGRLPEARRTTCTPRSRARSSSPSARSRTPSSRPPRPRRRRHRRCDYRGPRCRARRRRGDVRSAAAAVSRRPHGLNVPSYLLDRDSVPAVATTSTRPDRRQRLRHPDRVPVVHVPGGGQPLLPGQRPRRTSAATSGWPTRRCDDGARELVGHVRHAGRDRQGRPHVGGRRTTRRAHDCSVGTGQVHVDCAAKIADVQLGRMLARSWTTSASSTADARRADRRPRRHVRRSTSYGKTTSGAGDSTGTTTRRERCTTAEGSTARSARSDQPVPRPVAGIAAFNTATGGNLQFSYQSTSIQAWLIDRSNRQKLEAAAAAMLDVPGVIATYWRQTVTTTTSRARTR